MFANHFTMFGDHFTMFGDHFTLVDYKVALLGTGSGLLFNQRKKLRMPVVGYTSKVVKISC